jgi:hypothetical protein
LWTLSRSGADFGREAGRRACRAVFESAEGVRERRPNDGLPVDEDR